MQEPPGPAGPLPAPARERVVALAAERLSVLPHDEVPVALRSVARFTPAKRARLAAGPLAACVESDALFRQQVAEAAREALPGLADAVRDGTPVPAAPPADVAAVAYLLRPEGWQDQVEQAAQLLAAEALAAADADAAATVERLSEQLDAVRAAGLEEAAAARAALETAQAETAEVRLEVAALRRKVRELGDRAARAERALDAGAAPSSPAGPQAEPPTAAELRRLRTRLADAEAALAAGRSGGRERRKEQEVRLRVLLDAVMGATAGLRRELALAPVEERPADALAAELARGGAPAPAPLQGRSDDDPALLEALLGVPSVHLLVDGYNVTKTGYGEQTLQVQRSRLLAGLGALAARTRAETTVVFDGADGVAPSATAPRGVRLLFSRSGQTADDVLRRLVRAEPAGRPLVVVTSDREIVDDVRADGARTVPSGTLLALLQR